MRSARTLITLGLVAVAALVPAGCNIVGGAVMLLYGPPRQSAQYKLDPKRPTVVFVDDRSNVLPRRALLAAIGDSAQKTLLEAKAVETAIDCRSALAIAARDKYGEPQSIVEIGRAVSAEVIIYATVERLTISSDGQSVSPLASVWLKVIDATSEKRLWPEDEPNGKRIAIEPKFQQGYAPTSQSAIAQGENAVAETLGVAIAQVFYEHEERQSEIESK